MAKITSKIHVRTMHVSWKGADRVDLTEPALSKEEKGELRHRE